MQVLYQLDVRNTENPPSAAVLAEGLDADHDNPATRAEAAELALQAWAAHAAADRAVADLAPDWPTHRQPPVDRAILRLAHFEITTGHCPVGVAINEAVELAKQYAAEQSPAFVNGVLDKLAKQHTPGAPGTPDLPDGPPDLPPAPPPPAKPHADTWLDDAVNG